MSIDDEYKIETPRKEEPTKDPAATAGADSKDNRFFAVLVITGMFLLLLPVVLVSLHFNKDNTEYLFPSESEMKEFWKRQGWSDIDCVQKDSGNGGTFLEHSCSVTIRNKYGEPGQSRKLDVTSVRSSGKIISIVLPNVLRVKKVPDSEYLFPSESAMKAHWAKTGWGRANGWGDLICTTKEIDDAFTVRECTFSRFIADGTTPFTIKSMTKTGQIAAIIMEGVQRNLPPRTELKPAEFLAGFDLLAVASDKTSDLGKCDLSLNRMSPTGPVLAANCGDFSSAKTYFYVNLHGLGEKLDYQVSGKAYRTGSYKEKGPLSWDNVSSFFKQIMPDRSTDIIHCVNNYSGTGVVGCKTDSGIDFMAVADSSDGTATYSATAGQPLKPKKKSAKVSALFPSESAMKKYWEQNGWKNNITGCTEIKNNGETGSGETTISCTFRAPTDDEDPAFFDAQGRPEESEFKLNVFMRRDGQVVRMSFEDIPYNKAQPPHVAPYFNSLAYLSDTDYLDACENSDRWRRSDKRTGKQICDTISGVTFSKIITFITSYDRRAAYSVTVDETR